MQEQSAGHPLGVAFELAGRGPALAGLLVLLVVETLYSLGLAQLLNGSEAPDYARIGMIASAAGFGLFLIVALIQFQLARHLGGDEPDKPPPNVGLWIGLTLIYGIASILWSTMSSIALVRFAGNVVTYPLALGAMRVLFQVAMFAVLVRSAAAAHSGNRIGFGRVWSVLWSERICWLATYAALAAGVWLATWFGGMVLRPLAGDSAAVASLPGALIGAFGQFALILYAIAVYRGSGQNANEAGTFV